MTIETFRDLVLSIFLILAILFLIGSAVLILILFLNIKRLIDSLNIIVTRIKILSEYASEVGKPLITVAAFMQGVRQGFKAFGNMFGKRKEEVKK